MRFLKADCFFREQLIKSSNSEGIVCRTLENLGYKRSRKMAEAETSKTFVNNKEVESKRINI